MNDESNRIELDLTITAEARSQQLAARCWTTPETCKIPHSPALQEAIAANLRDPRILLQMLVKLFEEDSDLYFKFLQSVDISSDPQELHDHFFNC